jgi:hypothetical protein
MTFKPDFLAVMHQYESLNLPAYLDGFSPLQTLASALLLVLLDFVSFNTAVARLVVYRRSCMMFERGGGGAYLSK